ncbi:MAG: hypothetical protein K2X28_00785 [Alphaproteobacteria bacterium]|nr:hypothetical protein [Alphaproteobacteria bacterium]
MKKLALFLCIVCFAAPLYGDSVTNQELLAACKDKSSATQNFCYGFIISAANAAQFYRNIVDVEQEFIDICLPEKVSNQEVVDLYISWAEKHLDLAKGPAFLGVTTSFSQKYSCPPEQKTKQKVTAF